MKKDLKLWHLSVMAVATCVFAVIIQIIAADIAATGGRLYDYEIFGYSLEFFRHNQYLLAEEGLQAYQFKALPLDMVYPFFYVLTALMAWELLVKEELPKLYWSGAALMVVVVLLDYLENIRLGLLLFGLQPASRDFVETTSVITTTKWVLIAVALSLILAFSIRKFQQNRSSRS